MPVWARFDRGIWILAFHVKPGAKSNEIIGEHGGRLKIKISAPPADNEANNALIDFIAKAAGVPRSRVKLLHGQTSRLKTLGVEATEDGFMETLLTRINRPPS
ncbi:MAG: DUF167 domain-containing protein [Thiobacillaceae bacterium]